MKQNTNPTDKQLYQFLLVLIIMLFIFGARSSCYAQEVLVKTECELTPAVWQLKAWPKPEKTNNLRRITGSTEFAVGDKIIIEGIITDMNCIPVKDAIVQIWQADGRGVMPNFNGSQHDLDANFLYSGTAVTDNFGRYRFITILPGALKYHAPFIKFHIIHEDFLDMETVMFFENQSRNAIDKILLTEVPENKRYLLVAKNKKSGNYISQDDIKYQFDITLEGKNKYLKY